MKYVFCHIILLSCIYANLKAQDSTVKIPVNLEDTVTQMHIKGQVSTYGNYNFDNKLNLLFGGNFIPEITYEKPLKKYKLFDLDASANLSGSVNFHLFDSAISQGELRPYRTWLRYSGRQFEVRAGLQELNFGSATILRPLRWFDQVDPRDPLSLTSGVWGLLGRYYLLNNARIWAWALYGNHGLKGWEQVPTNKHDPEFGGRLQWPVLKGDAAITVHHRVADSRSLGIDSLAYARIPENRIGLDGKWDVGVGLWFELSYIHKDKDIGPLTNQTFLELGTDYTFGIGNGLNVIAEHMLLSYDEKAFTYNTTENLSAITASYPLGLFNNVSTVLLYDWRNQGFYSFLNFKRDLKYFTLYILAYINPKNQPGIQRNELVSNYSGKGIQLMLVYNFIK